MGLILLAMERHHMICSADTFSPGVTVKRLLEVCVATAESVRRAERGGADRVELCADLAGGGTTPSIGTLEAALSISSIPIHAIIRPRAGDFCYTELEFDCMRRDVIACREVGVHGVVFGILLTDGSVDVRRCATLVELARPMSVTFHRAFDVAAEPYAALDSIIKIGADRLLTSGMAQTAPEGADLIRSLVERAGERVIVMPGSGIRASNIRQVARATGASEFHMTANASEPSPVAFKRDTVAMSRSGSPEYQRVETSIDNVREIKAILAGAA